MPKTVPRLRPALRSLAPNLSAERDLWTTGNETVVGLDEVGRGSWAGPISVGAAVVPPGKRVYKIRDSKMLTEIEREALFDRIADWCVAWAVGHASAVECDELGMSQAQKVAARRALDGLGIVPDAVLYDGNWDFTGAPARARHRRRRRDFVVHIGGVDSCQGDTRPDHARRGAPLPALGLRGQQGLSGPVSQGVSGLSRTQRHSQKKLGVHGGDPLVWRSSLQPAGDAATLLRLTYAPVSATAS